MVVIDPVLEVVELLGLLKKIMLGNRVIGGGGGSECKYNTKLEVQWLRKNIFFFCLFCLFLCFRLVTKCQNLVNLV